MKAIQSNAVQELDNLTVPEAEEIIEEALEELSYSTDPGLSRALRFLAPAGYQAIVELCGENGRSKRRNAQASTFNPEEDEIRIYFERIDGTEEHERAGAAPRNGRTARTTHAFDEAVITDPPAALPADIDDRIRELCTTLAEAERGGHAFIALKWFRDSFLPRKTFNWNQTPESRQMILAEAILRGVVLTSKIPNPKTPAYPTTTIRLNRAEANVPDETQRFRPIAIQGEAFSISIEQDSLDQDREDM
ncbi:hypothetical protein ACFPT7_10910 [Acidicapsa dinghuensis]|uniref:Uncharacterized protein n=1 Tax=Acidicapsa dinghuensis TaxID=2218256 RepID=A0ABW1EG48_9BACT|nr:hypothetical protein [Acidicapsa dinghuensis]